MNFRSRDLRMADICPPDLRGRHLVQGLAMGSVIAGIGLSPNMNKRLATTTSALVLLLGTPVAGAHSPPSHAKVFFIEPANGAVVTSPVRVEMGIEGFGITPAGTKGKRRHTAGHHHVLIDLDQLPDMDEAIPRDGNHVHLDGGETEILLELSPGEHSLQLLLGDEVHEPQAPPLISEKIRITVQ